MKPTCQDGLTDAFEPKSDMVRDNSKAHFVGHLELVTLTQSSVYFEH
jgi:hypothetical protein